MTRLAARHGVGGDDKLWMAPWQEVYEYLWIRDQAVLKTTRKGREVFIELTLPKSPSSFRHRALSLVVNTNSEFDIVVPKNAGVKVTSNGKSNHNLINILW